MFLSPELQGACCVKQGGGDVPVHRAVLCIAKKFCKDIGARLQLWFSQHAARRRWALLAFRLHSKIGLIGYLSLIGGPALMPHPALANCFY